MKIDRLQFEWLLLANKKVELKESFIIIVLIVLNSEEPIKMTIKRLKLDTEKT